MAKYKDSYIISGGFQHLTSLEILPGKPGLPWDGTFATGVFNSIPLHSKPLAQAELRYSSFSGIFKSIQLHSKPLAQAELRYSSFTGIFNSIQLHSKHLAQEARTQVLFLYRYIHFSILNQKVSP